MILSPNKDLIKVYVSSTVVITYLSKQVCDDCIRESVRPFSDL